MGKAATIVRDPSYMPTMAEALELFIQLRRSGQFAGVNPKALALIEALTHLNLISGIAGIALSSWMV